MTGTREHEIRAIVKRHVVVCDSRLSLRENTCDSLTAAEIHAEVERLVGADVPGDWLMQDTINEWAAKAAKL